MITGIDYSQFQESNGKHPDLNGLSFAFHKATEGSGWVDPNLSTDLQTIRKAGLVCGVYHFFHSFHDADAQAAWFLKNYHPEIGDIIALDWESGGYDTAGKDRWIHTVKSRYPHNKVGVYCNRDYMAHLNNHYGDFLWIADPGSPAGSPRTGNLPWKFHQYSSAGNLDHDVARFNSRQELRTWAGFPAPVHTTLPQMYTVNAGDTLARIAVMHHTTWQILATLNHLANPNLIFPGEKLRVR